MFRVRNRGKPQNAVDQDPVPSADPIVDPFMRGLGFSGSKSTSLVAEWIHFTLFGLVSSTIKLKVYTLGGL